MMPKVNLVDKYCLDLFPEIVNEYEESEINDDSDCGSYIFHGLIFNDFVIKNRKNKEIMKRVADYLEYLSSDQNIHLNTLAQVGLLEAFTDQNLTEIIPYLQENTKKLLPDVAKFIKFNLEEWMK